MMKALLLKEFNWNWRSFRYPALLLVFLFFALLEPPTIKYMNEILAYFAEMELPLPPPTPEAAFIGFLSDISQVGILILIFVSMASVAKEKETGVAGWILSKPVSRWSYLGAKVIALYALIVVGMIASGAVAYSYTWSLLGPLPLERVVWAVVSLTAFALLFASITFALSAVLKTPLQAGGLAVFIFFSGGLLNMIVSKTSLLRFYPNTLLGEMGHLVTGASGAADIAVPLMVTLAISIGIVVLAGMRFAKLEL